jgi:magnesium-transporting ATPase (P-type)
MPAAPKRAGVGGRHPLVSSEQIVPGDVMLLSAGNIVPADAAILAA